MVLSLLFFIIERVFGNVRGPVLRRGWLTDVAYFSSRPL